VLNIIPVEQMLTLDNYTDTQIINLNNLLEEAIVPVTCPTQGESFIPGDAKIQTVWPCDYAYDLDHSSSIYLKTCNRGI